jgi:hypothetical protein
VARIMRPASVVTMAKEYFPALLRQREKCLEIDTWFDGGSGDMSGTDIVDGAGPYRPEKHLVSKEYDDLASRTHTPWLMLATDTMAQTMLLDGVRRPGANDNLGAWTAWQQNGMDARQLPLHDAILRHGLATMTILPGRLPLTRQPAPVMRAHSALNAAAFYAEPDTDEFPMLWMRATPSQVQNSDGLWLDGWSVEVMDEQATHYLTCWGDGARQEDWTYVTYDEHGLGFVPAVTYENRTQLGGRVIGEVEPFIPLARRIQQDVFDRLIVQRFGAWKVRYIAGMVEPDNGDVQAEKMRLAVEEILVSTSTDTKFGTLDASDIKQFIDAHQADLRDFSATTQIPPHHALGLSSNLQSEALVAAETGLRRKSVMRKIGVGERHERSLRVAAFIRGDMAEANAYDLQSRWRDTDNSVISQVADALGKLAGDVGVPQQMLWEKYLPGWTDSDTQRALELTQSGAIDALLTELEAAANGGQLAGATR